ncbi:MAG: iron ABC transporter permease [Planctomycetia bacterium]|nr:iron ABC transporter permease [Planctomycetia bacterium]
MPRTVARYVWLLVPLMGLAALLAPLGPATQRTWQLVGNTAWLAAFVCALSVPLGIALALLIVRTDLPLRRAAGLALAWLLFVPLYVQVGAWEAGFGLEGWQTFAGFGPAWLTAWRGAVWVHTAAAVPWVAAIVAIGLRTIPPELEEQALLDAAPLVVLRKVTLRMAWPLVAAATLWVAISAGGEIAVTDQFQVRTYAEEVYTQTALGASSGELPIRILPGIVLTGWLALAAVAFVMQVAPRGAPSTLRRPMTFGLAGSRVPAAAGVALVLALLVGVPLANLAWKAGVQVLQTEAGRQRHWSLVKCARIIAESPARYRREIRDSIEAGCAAATVAVAAATWLAWRARRSRRWAAVLGTVIVLAAAIPGPVVGLGIIRLLNQPDWSLPLFLYDRTILPPVLAQSFRALPLVCLLLWHAFHTIPTDELDLAALDGAGPTTTLFRIVLPQRLPALAAAWLVAFVVSVGELGATILVAPPGFEPLSVRISGLLHYGVEDQVAGICLALSIAFALVGAAIIALLGRWLAAAATRRSRRGRRG